MARRGNAAFVYTNDDGHEVVHRLGAPLREIRPRARQTIFRQESLDGTAIEAVAVGDALWEMEARLRYDNHPEDAIRLQLHGARNTTLRYYPDLSKAGFFDAKLLPPDTLGAVPDTDFWFAGDYEWTVLLRRTDGGTFGQVTLGSVLGARVVSHLRGGGSLADWTFTRSAVGLRRSPAGVLETIASGVPRTHWRDGEPFLLLESSKTNLVANPIDFSAWTGGGIATSGQSDPAGGTNAYLLTDDDGGGAESVSTAVSFSGNTVKPISVFVRQGTSPATGTIRLRDSTAAANRLLVALSWSGGVPQVAMTTGTHLETVAYSGGWYRLVFLTTAVTASNSHTFDIFPAGVATTGDVYVYLAQAENGEFPTSPIASASIRPVEALSRTLPAGLTLPSAAIAVLIRYRAGMAGNGGLSNPRVLQIGTGSPGAGVPGLSLYWPAASTLQLLHSNGTSTATSSLSLTVAYGDDVDVLIAKDSDGSGFIAASVNGGAASVNTLAALAPAPGGWNGGATAYVNSRDGGTGTGSMLLRNVVFMDGVPTGTAANALAAARRFAAQG